jgi:hypothetical protein
VNTFDDPAGAARSNRRNSRKHLTENARPVVPSYFSEALGD